MQSLYSPDVLCQVWTKDRRDASARPFGAESAKDMKKLGAFEVQCVRDLGFRIFSCRLQTVSSFRAWGGDAA